MPMRFMQVLNFYIIRGNRPNEKIIKEPIEKLNGGNSDNPIVNKERKIVKKDGVQRKIERKPVSDKQNNRTSNIEKQPAKVEYSVSKEKEFQRKSIKENRIIVNRRTNKEKKITIAKSPQFIRKRGDKK
jgi:hypothetical protein